MNWDWAEQAVNKKYYVVKYLQLGFLGLKR